MSFLISSNTSVNNTSLNTGTTANVSGAVQAPAYRMASDSVKLSNVAGTNEPLPMEAGGWKKFSNSVGEFFSNIADGLKFGETYNLIRQEFNQVDMNRNATLDIVEFNLATLNLTDFWGSEYAKADQDRNGRVSLGEYVDYRKQQLSYSFER